MSDAGPYSITFNNYSSVEFALSRLDANPFPSSAAWVSKPQSTLIAADGSQVVAISETDTIIETDFSVIWSCSAGRFGVRMHVPGQFIPPIGPTMGTAPYYYVGQDSDTSPNPPSFSNWQQQGAADAYTWTGIDGLAISLTSTAGKSSLQLTVTIDNA